MVERILMTLDLLQAHAGTLGSSCNTFDLFGAFSLLLKLLQQFLLKGIFLRRTLGHVFSDQGRRIVVCRLINLSFKVSYIFLLLNCALFGHSTFHALLHGEVFAHLELFRHYRHNKPILNHDFGGALDTGRI